jgi:hypothetical protein
MQPDEVDVLRADPRPFDVGPILAGTIRSDFRVRGDSWHDVSRLIRTIAMDEQGNPAAKARLIRA